MRCRRAKTFPTRSADRFAFHDIERTANGRSLHSAHENLPCGACGRSCVLYIFSILGSRLWASGILKKKAFADTSPHLGRGTLRTVPVYAGRMFDWQQIVMLVQAC